jgi:hypothetical protein
MILHMEAERDSLSAQLQTAMDQTAQWERKEAALEGQLAEVWESVSEGIEWIGFDWIGFYSGLTYLVMF